MKHSSSKNHKWRNLLSINLTTWTTNHHKMCRKYPPWAQLTQAEWRRRHWLVAATTIERSSCLYLTNSLCGKAVTRGVFWVLKHPQNYLQCFLVSQLAKYHTEIHVGMHKISPFWNKKFSGETHPLRQFSRLWGSSSTWHPPPKKKS